MSFADRVEKLNRDYRSVAESLLISLLVGVFHILVGCVVGRGAEVSAAIHRGLLIIPVLAALRAFSENRFMDPQPKRTIYRLTAFALSIAIIVAIYYLFRAILYY
jgi:hypothetical protein